MARKAKATASQIIDTAAAEELLAQQVEIMIDEEGNEEVEVQTFGPSVLSQVVTQLMEVKVEEDKVVVKQDKNEGVGQFIRKLIGEGLGNKQILEIVHEQYGNKNTTYACVAWYRNKMKKAGADVKKNNSLDWLQTFAKANGLSEEATAELVGKVA